MAARYEYEYRIVKNHTEDIFVYTFSGAYEPLINEVAEDGYELVCGLPYSMYINNGSVREVMLVFKKEL